MLVEGKPSNCHTKINLMAEFLCVRLCNLPRKIISYPVRLRGALPQVAAGRTSRRSPQHGSDEPRTGMALKTR